MLPCEGRKEGRREGKKVSLSLSLSLSQRESEGRGGGSECLRILEEEKGGVYMRLGEFRGGRYRRSQINCKGF